jgi:hypothetical protein
MDLASQLICGPISMDNRLEEHTMVHLVAQGSETAEAAAIAEEALRTWDHIARRLSPIVGDGGFRALYARGLHLTRVTYPWLAAVQGDEQASEPIIRLKLSLQRRDAADAKAASVALLATFTELLCTFVGEGLTTRLLSSVRAADSPRPAQETTK